MTRNQIVRLPITHEQIRYNKHGPGYVPCEVSGRWLQFSTTSHVSGGHELLEVNVMTNNGDGDRKLCELIIRKEDIVKALEQIRVE